MNKLWRLSHKLYSLGGGYSYSRKICRDSRTAFVSELN